MMKRLALSFSISLLLLTTLAHGQEYEAERQLVSQQPLEQAYRQAAWYFYLDQPYDALLQLDVAGQPEREKRLHNARSDLLKGGLLLQIGLPKQAADLMQQVLAQPDDQLPNDLRQYALLSYSRYLLSRGDKASAKQYAAGIEHNPQLQGVQQQLQQILDWPNIAIPTEPDFAALDGQAEMPYVIINQIQAIAASGDVDKALQWQEQLSAQLDDAVDPWFWQRWFGFTPQWVRQGDAETTAVLQYLQLLRAQLFVKQQDYASAQQVLAAFPQHTALDELALELYASTLDKSGQTSLLLGVYQQLLREHPLAKSSWQAAHGIGIGLEKLGEKAKALSAYQWADDYYSAQLAQNEQLKPLTLTELQANQLTPWQRYQVKQDRQLYQQLQDLQAMAKLTEMAPKQLARIDHLQRVIEIKLAQQQQLLQKQLPELRAQWQQLSQQFDQLSVQANQATQQVYPQAWLPLPLFAQQQKLERAKARLQRLHEASSSQSTATNQLPLLARQQQRLDRLQGLLQWQYAQQRAESQWQVQKQRQAISSLLPKLQQRIQSLSLQPDATPRLTAQRQRLDELKAQQANVLAALTQAQTTLLAELNGHFYRKASMQKKQLTQWSRRNKQALARLLEERLQEQP